MQIFIVRTNGIVLAVYAQLNHAETHARTITGARVEPHTVLMQLPLNVVSDIASEDWDEDITPMLDPADITVTKPDTPRSKSKKNRR